MNDELERDLYMKGHSYEHEPFYREYFQREARKDRLRRLSYRWFAAFFLCLAIAAAWALVTR